MENELNTAQARIAELEQQIVGIRLDVITQIDAHAVTRAELADLKAQEPVAWFTDDRESDKSATTYDKAVAERWKVKGWPVGKLYAAPVVSAEPQGVADVAPGLELAAKHLENEASEYAYRFASYDPETGATEFRSNAQDDYYNELHERAAEIRALAPAPSTTEGQP